jgi:hypothetical protein
MIPYEKYPELRQELSSIRIDLDADPASIGVSNINKKIADVNAQKERVASVLGEAIANVYEREHNYAALQLDYDIKAGKLLNSDDSIKNLKSEGLRSAALQATFSEEYLKAHTSKIDLTDAEGFLKFVQSKYNQLDSANSNISRQISVVELQLEIGEVARATGSFRERTISVAR